MTSTTTSFVKLPPELILDIADHLPLDAGLALKLTHPRLNNILRLDARRWNTPASHCAHLAVRTYLTKPTPKPSHMRCILCKAIYPISIFKSSSSPACVPIGPTDDANLTDVVELPPRFCSWHVSRLVRVIHTKPGGRNEWISHIDEMCMHCGAAQRWAKCNCKCDSCSSRTVRTYTRYLNNDKECRRYWFWKESSKLGQEGHAQLWVRETRRDPGESQTPGQDATLTGVDVNNTNTVINLPVRFDSEELRIANDFP